MNKDVYTGYIAGLILAGSMCLYFVTLGALFITSITIRLISVIPIIILMHPRITRFILVKSLNMANQIVEQREDRLS